MKLEKIVGKSPNYNKNSTLLLNNFLVVKKSLPKISIEKGIDWDIKADKNERTLKVYLFSLHVIKDLTYSYNDTGKQIYLKKARDIILDWYYKCHNNRGIQHVWNEHAVSSRILNVLFFQNVKNNYYKINKLIINDIINSHCNFLYNEDNYKNNNHGIMMDNALLAASYFSENVNKQFYIEKAFYRLKYTINRDFTRKGLHLENSPEYHRLVLNLLSKSEYLMSFLNLKFDVETNRILNRAKKVSSYIVKPNKIYPLIGDTGLILDKKLDKNYVDFTDFEGGFGVYHYKNYKNPEQSTYLTFKSGAQKTTHKHNDDLSITLFMDGHDILVDSGKYSYDNNDSFRKFLISPKAHNTIFIENKDYTYKLNTYPNKLRISDYRVRGNNKIIQGVNNLYSDVKIKRSIIFNKYRLIFLIDNVMSKGPESVIQNFNIDESAKIEKVNDLKYQIKINDKIYFIETFKQSKVSIASDILPGYISKEFSKLHENERLKFSKNGKRIIFVTAIYPEKFESQIKNAKFSKGVLTYEIFNLKKKIVL
ncbi:heparinase II/III family protein [Salinicoccus sp. YB14-2]|uniref:heparinase II/III domain-containing protein n=1 Tax=Salinicoccus sp. YB14-2 TaxID=1572701 RepID=UPI00068C4DB2|nr:heparinase II/III family protein [Salinicoccus sp. YB14-2]